MINESNQPGHFYSVIPYITNDYNDRTPKFINIDFDENSHINILNELADYLTLFDDTFGIKDGTSVTSRANSLKFSLANGGFEGMDARLLYYFIQKNKPKKIIEIGGGCSTLLMHNTNIMFNLGIEIICIEPYPNNSLKKLHSNGSITLIEKKLENTDLEIFKSLDSNDILFIDSSHVLKINSDVMCYFTSIFPILKKGVFIHIHDIFFPFDYPLRWTKGGIFWNEQYFLYIFLQYNTKFKVKFCNSYSEFKYKEKLRFLQQNTYERVNNIYQDEFPGGSIWLLVNE